eukprot:1187145-Prorocentrum_minimum.AAC.2
MFVSHSNLPPPFDLQKYASVSHSRDGYVPWVPDLALRHTGPGFRNSQFLNLAVAGSQSQGGREHIIDVGANHRGVAVAGNRVLARQIVYPPYELCTPRHSLRSVLKPSSVSTPDHTTPPSIHPTSNPPFSTLALQPVSGFHARVTPRVETDGRVRDGRVDWAVCATRARRVT